MRHLYLLLLTLFLVAGCGNDNPITNAVNNVSDGLTDTFGTVAHRSWGSYNLYYFQNGQWRQIVSLGQPTGPLPDLGATPVMMVHGLGGSIRSGRFTPLATAIINNGATGIVGFEYDTLDPVGTNGQYLTQAYTLINQNQPGKTWRHVAHSMGSLVSRSCFENGQLLPIALSGNKAVFVAGPHTGTPIADAIGNDPDAFRSALQYLVFHNIMEFTNSDLKAVAVTGKEQGFVDLRDNGVFTTSLNIGAASKHPQWEYRTVAGDRRGADFEAIDSLLNVFTDDGIVNTVSANNPVIGQLEFATVGQDHSSIIDSAPGIPVIIRFLQ